MNQKAPASAALAAAIPPGSTLVTSPAEIDRALDAMGREISADLAALRPVAVAIMNGGLVFAGQLLTRLPFALECDYIHVRRYGRLTSTCARRSVGRPRRSSPGWASRPSRSDRVR